MDDILAASAASNVEELDYESEDCKDLNMGTFGALLLYGTFPVRIPLVTSYRGHEYRLFLFERALLLTKVGSESKPPMFSRSPLYSAMGQRGDIHRQKDVVPTLHLPRARISSADITSAVPTDDGIGLRVEWIGESDLRQSFTIIMPKSAIQHEWYIHLSHLVTARNRYIASLRECHQTKHLLARFWFPLSKSA